MNSLFSFIFSLSFLALLSILFPVLFFGLFSSFLSIFLVKNQFVFVSPSPKVKFICHIHGLFFDTKPSWLYSFVFFFLGFSSHFKTLFLRYRSWQIHQKISCRNISDIWSLKKLFLVAEVWLFLVKRYENDIQEWERENMKNRYKKILEKKL